MDKKLFRLYALELLGTFALVYFAAGAVCVNHVTYPVGTSQSSPALPEHPGVVGVALAQGLILAIMLTLTVPVSGGYLNPAITIMLWVFNRLDSKKTAWFLGAQLVGAVLAGMCLRYTFEDRVLRDAAVGTPHLNPEVFSSIHRGVLIAGTSIELVLTFFLVLAIFGIGRDGGQGRLAGLAGGAAMTAAVVVGFALTGAALNPARWFGTVFWEFAVTDRPGGETILGRSPLTDVFVFVAGPVLGALLAGIFYFKVLLPTEPAPVGHGPASAAESAKAATAIKARK